MCIKLDLSYKANILIFTNQHEELLWIKYWKELSLRGQSLGTRSIAMFCHSFCFNQPKVVWFSCQIPWAEIFLEFLVYQIPFDSVGNSSILNLVAQKRLKSLCQYVCMWCGGGADVAVRKLPLVYMNNQFCAHYLTSSNRCVEETSCNCLPNLCPTTF